VQQVSLEDVLTRDDVDGGRVVEDLRERADLEVFDE